MGSISKWGLKRFGKTAMGVGNFIRRHTPFSRPAAETTGLMVGAALLLFVVLIALRQNLWTWVERASWVIALVLFPAAIYQLVVLQREQRRIADQLGKQPDVRVGLRIQAPGSLPEIAQELRVPVQWRPSSPVSDLVKLDLSAVNVGSLTAHHVVINLVFPKQVQYVPGPIPAQLRDEPEGNRWRLIFGEYLTLGIRVTVDLAVTVQVGVAWAQGFPILAEVVMQDRPYIDSVIWVVCESPKEPANAGH